MPRYKNNRPNIGVLAGWQAYTGTIHSFLDHVFRGMKAAARDYACDLMIGCGVAPFYQGTRYTALPIELPGVDFIPVGPWNTDGLIICAPLFFEEGIKYFQDLTDHGFPVVYASNRDTGPAVTVDNEHGILQAVEHLVAHGHQRIAFISGHQPPEWDSAARLQGYLAALRQYGLEYDPRLVVSGGHEQGPGYQAMKTLLAQGESFSAVIASNDESAIGAMDALRDAGLIVPEDVALIGFDDRLEARATIPLLTTVHHPMFELGYRSLELLYQILEGTAAPDKVVRIPTHLIVRESCGCLPGAEEVFRSRGERHGDAETRRRGDTKASEAGVSAWVEDADSVSPRLPVTASPRLRVSASPRLSSPYTGPDLQAAQAMLEAVYGEMVHLSRGEVEYLCCRLIDAFKISLTHGAPATFLQAFQQILEHAANIGEELFAWQGAITALKNQTPGLLLSLHYVLSEEQIEHMLHQARVAISEVSRGQFSRHLVSQATIAGQIGLMTARFFAAETEAEVFDILSQSLPDLGIQHAVVALYEPEGSDRYAWSQLKTPSDCPADTARRFNTYQFPPPGLYPDDRPFQVAILPLVLHNEPLGYAAFSANDLENLGTIARQLVSALRGARLHQQAISARQAAEEANQSKSRFLSIVSHELRTPLNLIFGLSNMMIEEGCPVNEQEILVNRKDLERIYVGVQHLESLIRDVIDLARSDIGQLSLVCQQLDLHQVLDAVAMIGEQLAHGKELTWRTDIAPCLPPVRGDQTRLRQVILNLVNNAVKFTSYGSVTLSAKVSGPSSLGTSFQGTILQGTTFQGQFVTIAVSDTGLGIPLEEQEAIFDEFHQSKRTTARGFGGLGLGLAVCKRLVEMHGGQVGVSSSGEEGAGSTFYFTLPVSAAFHNDMPQSGTLQPAPAAPLPNAADGRQESSNQEVDRRESSNQKVDRQAAGRQKAERILLFIKEPSANELLKSHLSRQGFQVTIRTIDQASDWMDWPHGSAPDKILLDPGMTSERGWEILKKVKENPRTRDIPVLFYALENDQNNGEDGKPSFDPARRGAILDLNIMTKPLVTAELAEELVAQGLVEEERSGVPAGAHGSASGRTILLVDDDPAILDMHARILKNMASGCRILQAHNGREALRLIHAERPALVLLDLMMPEVDGFTVLETMQADEITRNIPVIVLTSQVLTEEDMARLNRGVASVLNKGMYSVQETLERVTDALSRKRRPGTDTQRLVFRAMTYIHAHYKEPISRGDIAAHVGVSERHLARCFQQEVGLAPITYLNRFRVKVAKMLLLTGRMNVTEVAMEVGFSASGYFTRVFREEEGVSPREYLRNRN